MAFSWEANQLEQRLEGRIKALEKLLQPERNNGVKLFALGSTHKFGESVAKHLNVPLVKISEKYFPDKEVHVHSEENVRRSSAFVIQSLYSDTKESVDQKLVKMLWLIGSLRDASVDEITAVIPYLGYARQDRKIRSREGVVTKYVAEVLEAVGVDRILTVDTHNLAAYQNAFRIRADNLECKNIFADYIAKELKGKDISILAPDAGGMGRARRFRNALQKRMEIQIPLAFLDKSHDGDEIKGSTIVGDVAPYTIVIDDMISGGSTIRECAKIAPKCGAEKVYAIATHGLFVGAVNENLSSPELHRIIVSDTVEPSGLSEEVNAKLTVLPTTELFADAIHRTYTGESLSSLFA